MWLIVLEAEKSESLKLGSSIFLLQHKTEYPMVSLSKCVSLDVSSSSYKACRPSWSPKHTPSSNTNSSQRFYFQMLFTNKLGD